MMLEYVYEDEYEYEYFEYFAQLWITLGFYSC
jgi:hypothetical protein